MASGFNLVLIIALRPFSKWFAAAKRGVKTEVVNFSLLVITLAKRFSATRAKSFVQ